MCSKEILVLRSTETPAACLGTGSESQDQQDCLRCRRISTDLALWCYGSFGRGLLHTRKISYFRSVCSPVPPLSRSNRSLRQFSRQVPFVDSTALHNSSLGMLVEWVGATLDRPNKRETLMSPSLLISRRYMAVPMASLLASENACISLRSMVPKPFG